MADIKEAPSGTCYAETLAKLFGLSVRRVRDLVREGVITPLDKTESGGRQVFDFQPTVQAYITHLADKAYGREKASGAGEEKLKELKLKADIALKEAQGELQLMKNEIAKGTYIERDEIRLEYERFFVTLKKYMLAIPPRVIGIIGSRLEPVECRALEKEIAEDITKILTSFVVAGITEEEEQARKITLPKHPGGRPKKK